MFFQQQKYGWKFGSYLHQPFFAIKKPPTVFFSISPRPDLSRLNRLHPRRTRFLNILLRCGLPIVNWRIPWMSKEIHRKWQVHQGEALQLRLGSPDPQPIVLQLLFLFCRDSFQTICKVGRRGPLSARCVLILFFSFPGIASNCHLGVAMDLVPNRYQFAVPFLCRK